MTFYEAALRVLEGAGRPLHFLEITEQSIKQNLLSHVGKTPEQTMLSRLAAMARRPRDRKIIVTARDTFALADWQVPEDAEALAVTGVPEPNPEEDLPPLRPAERHPEPRGDYVRAAGRGERKRRRDEEEDDQRGRRRRYPPIAEVVFEVLSEGSSALVPDEVLSRARSLGLVSDELTAEQMLLSLLEDNQRRIDAGRRPQYNYSKEAGLVSLERPGASPEVPAQELQAAFAAALGIPLEGGRPVLARAGAVVGAEASAELTALQALRAAVKDGRRTMARLLRRRLQELDLGVIEKATVKMLHGHHFREIKSAKRSREGLSLTARRKEGSVEVRYAIRLVRGTAPVDRKVVQEIRRDVGHYSAHLGLVLSAGDVRGDARSESLSSAPLVFLWCGEGLAEKFLEVGSGVVAHKVELFEMDEAFFAQAAMDAEEARLRREERHRQKAEEERDDTSRGSSRAPSGAGIEVAAGIDTASQADVGGPQGASDEGDENDGDEEEGDAPADGQTAAPGGAPGGAPGAAGERKRRRRRRRGRRGRGGAEGEAAAAGQGGGTAPNAHANPNASAPRGGPPSAPRPTAPAALLGGEASAPAPAPSAPRPPPPPSTDPEPTPS